MRDSPRAACRVGLCPMILGLLLSLPALQIAWAGSDGGTNRLAPPGPGDGLTVDRIVVELDSFRLYTFNNDRLISQYPIAVGMDTSPTPTGEFRVVNKLKNPWYTPEDKPARPPGPDNPLGTRWMGIDKPTYGLHGTRAPDSIGTRASEGCIRLRNEHAERLYERVRRGTEVVIRRSLERSPGPPVPAISVSQARLTRQGSYASLPVVVAASSRIGRGVNVSNDGGLAYAQCRLNVPLDVPFVASCFLNGNNCPPTVERTRPSARFSMTTGVQDFPVLSPGVLGGPKKNTLPAKREVFTEGGAPEVPPLPGTSSRLADRTRLPSFSPPRSCGTRKDRRTDKTEKVVCFMLSGPSESRYAFSPDSLTKQPGNPGEVFHRDPGSSPTTKPSRSPTLSGELFARDSVDGSSKSSGTTPPRIRELDGIEVSFPELDGGKHCAGARKPKPEEDSPNPRGPSDGVTRLRAEGDPSLGGYVPVASFSDPAGSRRSSLWGERSPKLTWN